METAGVLVAGESAAAMGYMRARRGVSPRQTLAILLICILVVGLPVGVWAGGSWIAATMSIEFGIVGLMVGLVIVRLLSGPSLRKALAARGQAHELPLTLRLTPQALVYELPDLITTARWPCVTDLYRTRKHWVFLAQNSVLVLPRRFFATAEAERAFIVEAASRMTDAARARSPDATRMTGA